MDEYTILESLDTDQLIGIRDADADQLNARDIPHFLKEARRDRIQVIDRLLAHRATENSHADHL